MVFVKQRTLGVEIAVDMNNIYHEVDNYINGTFMLGEEVENKGILKGERFKRNNALSLMLTLNHSMDDSFILGKRRNFGFNYKMLISFRKRLLKFMERKFINNNLEKL